MTPDRANDIGYLLDNFEQCAVAAHAEQTDSADERLREAAKAITDLVDRLRAHIERIQEWGPDQRTQRERADIAEENLSAALTQRDQVVEQLAAVEQDRDRLSEALAEADRELERMRERLASAETVCTIFGWTASSHDSDRDKAVSQAWMDWHHAYGSPKPDAEWRARITELAARRDAIRAKTLAAIRAEPTPQAVTK